MPPRRNRRRVDLLWVVLLALISFSAAAQPRPAPWTLEQQASEIQSVDESQAFHSKRAKRLSSDPVHAETKTRVASRVIERRAPGAGTNQTIHPQEIVVPEDLAAEITQEIRLLAYGLEYDPLKIFLFVRNQIDMQRLSGIGKSALETLVARQGNDMEQAALMVALLRASGIPASYVYGGMTYTPEQVVNWWGSGTRTQPTTVARTWVQFEVDGTVYAADPAYKQFEYTSAVDFFPQLGFDLDELIAQVTQGATQGPNSIRNFNTANLEALMRTYTARLTDYLRQNHFADEPQDILGGRSILPVELDSLGSLSLLPNYEIATWQFIPTEFHDSLTLRLQGQEHRFLGVELGTRRLTVTYNAGTGQPELRLDGDLILAAAAIPAGTEIEACFFPDFYVDRPGPTFPGFDCKRFGAFPGHTHALANSLRGAQGSVGTLDYAQKKLQDFREAGLPNASEAIRGETLNVLGRSFMNYTFTFYRQVLRAHGYESAGGSAIGWVSETGSGGIDWDYASIAVYALDDAQLDLQPVSRAGWHIGTAFEAGLFEHVFGAGTGLSTSKVLHLNNEGGGDTFYVTDQNFASIRPSLTNWDELQLNRFEAGLDAGQGFMILPSNGAVPLLSAQARAWISYGNSSDSLDLDGYRFGLGFNGGGAAEEGEIDDGAVNQWCEIGCFTYGNNSSYENGSFDNPTSGDPVDMLTGLLIVDEIDLALGRDEPLGVSFGRSYSSGAVAELGHIGRGWEHLANISISEGSQPGPYLGTRGTLETAAMIAYAELAPRIMNELVACYRGGCATEQQREILGWMVVNQMANWFVDETVENAVTFYQGFDGVQFVQLPDGSFEPPLGSSIELIILQDEPRVYAVRRRSGLEFRFGVDKLLRSVVDLHGSESVYSYAAGKLSRITDHYGRFISITYNGDLISSVADSTGRTVQYTYDADSNLVAITSPEGDVRSYRYDSDHRLITMDNELGERTITNTYNEVNQILSQTEQRQAGPATYQYFFSEMSNVELDPLGQRNTYLYDLKGRNIGFVNALGSRKSMRYDGQNRLISESNFRGDYTSLQYDNRHRLIRQSVNDERELLYAYDAQDNLIAITDAAGRVVAQSWSATKDLISRINEVGDQVSYAYTSEGLIESISNEVGVTTLYEHDSFGNLRSSRIGGRPASISVHDPIGSLISRVDEAGAQWSFTWDEKELPLSAIGPLGLTTTYEHDAVGRLTRMVDRNGSQLERTYTKSNMVASSAYSDGTFKTYTYDILDRRVSVESESGQTNFEYDALGRVTRLSDVNGVATQFAYDPDGNITEIVYPGNKTIRYEFNAHDEVTRVDNWLGEEMTLDYDVTGRLVERTSFNRMITRFTYDAVGRQVAVSADSSEGRNLLTISASRDPRGFLETTASTKPIIRGFGADSLIHSFDSTRSRLTEQNGQVVLNDSEGLLVEIQGRRTFTSDDQRRVTGVSGDINLQVVYDGLDRVARHILDGVERRYVRGIRGEILSELDSVNKPTQFYVYAAGEVVAMITPDGRTYDYLFDLSGNTVGLTNPQGDWANEYRYTPYGRATVAIEERPQPFRFAGGFGAMHLGGALIDMRARLYDTETGRFNRPDPLGFDGGSTNLFLYAFNNPLNFVDPSGLAPSFIGQVLNTIANAAVGTMVTFGDGLQEGKLGTIRFLPFEMLRSEPRPDIWDPNYEENLKRRQEREAYEEENRKARSRRMWIPQSGKRG